MAKNIRYSKEFKERALSMLEERQELSVKEVAQKLNISVTCLNAWKKAKRQSECFSRLRNQGKAGSTQKQQQKLKKEALRYSTLFKETEEINSIHQQQKLEQRMSENFNRAVQLKNSNPASAKKQQAQSQISSKENSIPKGVEELKQELIAAKEKYNQLKKEINNRSQNNGKTSDT